SPISLRTIVNSIGKTENWYYFFDGIKFTRDHGHYSLNIQFSNGSKAQNVGGDIQLGKVFDFYRCKIDRIDIHSMYSVYFWPNGKSMAISDEEYSIDVASGELLDKKGNKVESTVADEKNQAATSKKRWWQILLK
ncbi:MAG: hypothetical protein Q7T20_19290, partial [Saprospiraceae bacterium]|nr:hypothetical protein [Saprospiraceae bacterium]